MKRLIYVITVAIMLSVVAISAVSFAAEYRNTIAQSAATPAVQQDSSNDPGISGCYGRGKMVQLWADALGISVDEFVSLRSSGKTIADIAAEKGLKIEDVVQKVLKTDADYLDKLVANGQLTREKADEILKFKEQRLLERATTAPGTGPFSGKGFGGARCGYGAGRVKGSNFYGCYGGNPVTPNI